MEVTVNFALKDETKNTYKYEEVTSGVPVIGMLYVQKSAVGSKAPANLSVVLKSTE